MGFLTTVTGVIAILVAMATVGPRLLPYQVLPVLTGSMQPSIAVGSLAIVVPVRAEELAVGDVITFHHPRIAGAYVTHRIVAVEDGATGRSFVTRGDANASPDPWTVGGTGSGWRLAFTVPLAGGGLVLLGLPPVRTGLSAFALVALAMLALVAIWRPRTREVGLVPRAA